MIKIDEKKKTFYLSGKNYSYVMSVSWMGTLLHLYHGKKILESDVDYLLKTYGEKSVPHPDDINYQNWYNDIPQEFASFGKGDYHEPSFLLRRQDGSMMNAFSYVSYEVKKGAYPLKGLPSSRHADETLIITLKDKFCSFYVRLIYGVLENSDVLTRSVIYQNEMEEEVSLLRAYSFVEDMPNDHYDMINFTGVWARERKPSRFEVTPGIHEVHSVRGITSHQANNFIILAKKDTTEEYGDCYGYQLVYSGNFNLSVEYNTYNDSLRVMGGVDYNCFEYHLKKGESFIAPQVLLSYSSCGLGGLSRSISDFIRANIIRKEYAYQNRPILINNWEATYFDFTEEKLHQIIDEASELGIDTFVLDDGWFGIRNDDHHSLGDWFVNEKKLPHGLIGLSDYCKERNMKFGLWFEPEMISKNSELFKKHPSWAIGKEENERVQIRFQYLLDFTNQEVIDYIYSLMEKIIFENHISYVKWDMNRSLTEYYSSFPGRNQGEVHYREMLGVYQLANRLIERFPDVFFEGCAGGGGRFDCGMLYYFPQIWTSDDTDSFERSKIQYGTSYGYPLSSMSCHVSTCPNHQTGRTTPFSSRGLIASLGATGYELDLTKLSREEKELVKKQIQDDKKISSLILEGDLYRLSSPYDSDAFSFNVVSKDKEKAYFVYLRKLRLPAVGVTRFRLAGFDENSNYEIEETNEVVSGSYLMNMGVLLDVDREDFSSFCLHFKKVD